MLDACGQNKMYSTYNISGAHLALAIDSLKNHSRFRIGLVVPSYCPDSGTDCCADRCALPAALIGRAVCCSWLTLQAGLRVRGSFHCCGHFQSHRSWSNRFALRLKDGAILSEGIQIERSFELDLVLMGDPSMWDAGTPTSINLNQHNIVVWHNDSTSMLNVCLSFLRLHNGLLAVD